MKSQKPSLSNSSFLSFVFALKFATTQVRCALKPDLFAHQALNREIESLQVITEYIDFDFLARFADELFPRSDRCKDGRLLYPTGVMVRILVSKHLYNLSGERVEYQLLDHHRKGLRHLVCLKPVSSFRIATPSGCSSNVVSMVLLRGVVGPQIERHGYMARDGQITGVTQVFAPIQHFTREDEAQLNIGEIPEGCNDAKRRQKKPGCRARKSTANPTMATS